MERVCVICKRPLGEHSETDPPFCSERCRMVDLSNWLDGDYAIPGAPVDPNPETDSDIR